MTRFFLEISKVAFGGTGNWNWQISTGIGIWDWYWYFDTGISTCRCTGNRYWRIGTLLFMHLSLAAAFTLAILIVNQGGVRTLEVESSVDTYSLIVGDTNGHTALMDSDKETLCSVCTGTQGLVDHILHR